MAAQPLPTRIEERAGRRLTPDEVFEITSAREKSLSRLLVAYIVGGLAFMLLPGTFLGVWNLLSISGRQAAESVSASWIQAHGQAQVFGWIGSFILGIGFYSIPKLRRAGPFALSAGWTAWALWVAGVLLRWVANIYLREWRILLPLSAALQMAAFVVFATSVASHRPAEESKGVETWVRVVMGATLGFFLVLVVNLGATTYLALRGNGPAFPHVFDQRYLVLIVWGFLVPFVWGFSAKWLPIFLGLKPLRERWMWRAFLIDSAGVVSALFGQTLLATVLLLAGTLAVGYALRLFEAPQQPAKTRGVHASFPFFVRSAYVWLVIAAALGIWAAQYEAAAGIWGASRHALTVGFVAMMVFCVGQRILPSFAGMKLLFSPRLMFLSTATLTVGCFLRVSSEVLAYQGYATWAWKVLPISALTEMAAVSFFALNLLLTFPQPSTGELAKAAAGRAASERFPQIKTTLE
jgi:uncharacterized protein involved in response to NO